MHRMFVSCGDDRQQETPGPSDDIVNELIRKIRDLTVEVACDADVVSESAGFVVDVWSSKQDVA